MNALTHKEKQVADLVALAMTDKEIAKELSMSRFTVNSHLRFLFSKYGARNRVDLAMKHCAADHSKPLVDSRHLNKGYATRATVAK